MKIDGFWAALGIAAVDGEPTPEDREVAVLAVMQFRRAGGIAPPFEVFCAWESSSRAIWAEAGERLQAELVAALALCLRDPAALSKVAAVADPEAAAAARVSAALDAAEAQSPGGA